MIFRYSEYVKFLNHMKIFGDVTSVGRWAGEKAIILRHDVDLDIKAAFELAMIEHHCGISSSFFILLTSDFYNPATIHNRSLIREMGNLGCEIGLHFDPQVYVGISSKNLQQKALSEAKVLEEITKTRVRSISLHNPSIKGGYPLFDGFVNAYGSDIFSDEHYLSDSCMDFHGKDPYKFVEQAKVHHIQILLHPFHFSKHGYGYERLVPNLMMTWIKRVDSTLRINSGYRKMLGKPLLDYLVSKRESV